MCKKRFGAAKRAISAALAVMMVAVINIVPATAESRQTWRFNFTNTGATGDVSDGYTTVRIGSTAVYDYERGYGFTENNPTGPNTATQTVPANYPYLPQSVINVSLLVTYNADANPVFEADVPNGSYDVYFINFAGSEDRFTVEGATATSAKDNNNLFVHQWEDVAISDGKVTISVRSSGTNRLAAIIIVPADTELWEVVGEQTGTDPTPTTSTAPTPTPSASTGETYRFNFTTAAGAATVTGWTNVHGSSNNTDGSGNAGSTLTTLGSVYTDAKGYGFVSADGSKALNARGGANSGAAVTTEGIEVPAGVAAKVVFLQNVTFEVKTGTGDFDVYLIMSNRDSNSSAYNISVEGTATLSGNVPGTTTIAYKATVACNDGFLTITGADVQNRCVGIVIIPVLPVAPTINTASLPNAPLGAAYSQTVSASGTAPITFAVSAGSLPAGLSLNAATGVISGIPTAPGSYMFTVAASNATGQDAKEYTVVVAATAPTITTGSLPSGKVGDTYNAALAASGSPTIVWSFTGTLPPGLAFGANGTISGVPSETGQWTITVKASNGTSPDAARDLTIKIVDQVQNWVPLGDRALAGVYLGGGKGASGTTLLSYYDPAVDGSGNSVSGVAMKTSGVYLSWRAFENAGEATYALYRGTTETNCTTLITPEGYNLTNFYDPTGTADSFYKVVGSNDAAKGLTAKIVKPWANFYLTLNLSKPANQTMPGGATCYFTANDSSVGDLDGDGDLELIVKWYPSNAQDVSIDGYTGTTFLDAYDVNWNTGSVRALWRVNLGINIRSGAHYAQFGVGDFDGDGADEMMVQANYGTTAYKNTNLTWDADPVWAVNGGAVTIGAGTGGGYIGKNADDMSVSATPATANGDYRNTAGHVTSNGGAQNYEYVMAVDGADGRIIDAIAQKYRGDAYTDWQPDGGKSSDKTNRPFRFNVCVANLDGEGTAPYYVLNRGYYGVMTMAAYKLTGAKLSVPKYYTTGTNQNPAQSGYGAGNHAIMTADVNGDGKDEIVSGGVVFTDDPATASETTSNGITRLGMKMLYSSTLGHGDAEHIGDWIPSNPGLEIMQVHEGATKEYHVEIHDAEDGGTPMTGYFVGADTGRGMAGDVDPTSVGAEFWGAGAVNGKASSVTTAGGVFSTESLGLIPQTAANSRGELVRLSASSPSQNFSLYWDGDLMVEMQDHSYTESSATFNYSNITKWDYLSGTELTYFQSTEAYTNNGTKGNPCLSGDLIGDWREEVIFRVGTTNAVRVYMTTLWTEYVVKCLMLDQQYRGAIAWQNGTYNQPPHTSYLPSEGTLTSRFTANNAGGAVELTFTQASDGDRSFPVEGYKIYRREGAGTAPLVAISGSNVVKALDYYIETANIPVSDLTLISGAYTFTNPGTTVYTNITTSSSGTTYTASRAYKYTDTSAIPGKTYQYIVVAQSNGRDSYVPKPISITTAAAPIASASGTGSSNQLKISWLTATNAADGNTYYYRVRNAADTADIIGWTSIASKGTYVPAVESAEGGVTGDGYTIIVTNASLADGTEYKVQIRVGANGATSNLASAVPYASYTVTYYLDGGVGGTILHYAGAADAFRTESTIAGGVAYTLRNDRAYTPFTAFTKDGEDNLGLFANAAKTAAAPASVGVGNTASYDFYVKWSGGYELTFSGTTDIALTFTNNTASDVTAALIIAVYRTADDRLVKTYSQSGLAANAQSYAVLTAGGIGTDYPAADYYARGYAWNDGYEPYLAAVDIY
ncbi:MAG: putative Ig domain-containing protein [Clostridiales bacterium]|jgi:hypothetical protein|nr:putative Ig domain-containing protein [Clostridiales bacterium]